jgi:hypothetical protein
MQAASLLGAMLSISVATVSAVQRVAFTTISFASAGAGLRPSSPVCDGEPVAQIRIDRRIYASACESPCTGAHPAFICRCSDKYLKSSDIREHFIGLCLTQLS